MDLFREKGFEPTTMRDIAAKAGVALGGAYYSSPPRTPSCSPSTARCRRAATPGPGRSRRPQEAQERIRCILEKRLELLEPNRKFCAALFRHAPDSDDPLSPFSDETRAIREGAIEHMRIAVEGSDAKVPPDLQPRLPYLLWLYQMALIMFWLYDRSPNQEKTQRLMVKSLGLLVNLLRISTLPLMKPLRKAVLELVEGEGA